MTTEQAPSELTDAQIERIWLKVTDRHIVSKAAAFAIARAVIAADRALVASQAQPAAEPRQDSVHAVESSSPPAAALGRNDRFDDPPACSGCGAMAGVCSDYPNCPGGKQ